MPKVIYRLVNKAAYHEEAVRYNSWPIGFYFKNAHWNVNRLPPTALGNTFKTSYHPWLLWCVWRDPKVPAIPLCGVT